MASWADGYVLTNGIRLHYIRTGGEKPQVVLCHGFSDNAQCWTPVARELEADYDVIMVDARCHGKSDAPADGNHTGAMADDLAGLIRGLGLDRPVVAGHSMGAGYTQQAAAHYPELMRAIVLEDPGWRVRPRSGGDRGDWAAQMRAGFEELQAMPYEETWAKVRQQFNPAVSDEMVGFLTQAKRELNLSILNRDFGPDDAWRGIIAKIHCPFLLFTGNPERGALVSEEAFAEAITLAPQIERVHVDTVGHLIRFEAFETFVGALKPFLARAYG